MSKYVREIDSIQGLRNTPTSDAAAAHVRTPTGKSGVFLPFDADPFGNGDDGAVAVQASDGTWWARQNTLQDQILNIEDFGADPERPDNYGPINDAINFLESIPNNEGGTLYIPPNGQYDYSQTLDLGNTKISVLGAAPNRSALRYTGSNNAMKVGFAQVTFRDFRLSGNGTGDNGIYALGTGAGMQNSIFSNVVARNFNGSAIRLADVFEVTFIRVDARESNIGIHLGSGSGPANDIDLHGCNCRQNDADGFRVENFQSINIHGGNYANNVAWGVRATSGTGIHVYSPYSEKNNSGDVRLTSTNGFTVHMGRSLGEIGVQVNGSEDGVVQGSFQNDTTGVQLGGGAGPADSVTVTGIDWNGAAGGSKFDLVNLTNCQIMTGGSFEVFKSDTTAPASQTQDADLGNTPNTGDAATDDLINALTNAVLNSGIGST